MVTCVLKSNDLHLNMIYGTEYYFKVRNNGRYYYVCSKGKTKEQAIRRLLFAMFSFRQNVSQGWFKNRIEEVEHRYRILKSNYEHLIVECSKEEYIKNDEQQMS